MVADAIDAPSVVDGTDRSGTDAGTSEPVVDAPDAAPTFLIGAASADQIDEAMDRVTATYPSWRRTPAPGRAAVLRAAADELRALAEDLAQLVVRETGKPITQARGEVVRAASTLATLASEIEVERAQAITGYSPNVWGLELREPRGVAVVLNSWNMPLQLAALKVGAALAAGCTVVLKPSPMAPASAAWLCRAFLRAGLPPGALAVVQGGSEVGRALVVDPRVKVVSLTGSDATGREVMALAATSGPKKVILELGGKNANIVFEDAQIDRAVRGLVSGFVRNQGAACTSATRILVQEAVYDEVVERAGEALGKVVVGDPYRREPAMGAIRHSALYHKLTEAVAQIAGRSDRLIGGTPVAVAGRNGHYMRPSIMVGVAADDPAHQTEMFGPLATVTPFSDAQNAVSIANATPFGLAAGVWSQDTDLVQYVGDELDVGTVYVNSYHRIDGIPLASEGRGASGFGAEQGRAGIDEFRSSKSFHHPSSAIRDASSSPAGAGSSAR